MLQKQSNFAAKSIFTIKMAKKSTTQLKCFSWTKDDTRLVYEFKVLIKEFLNEKENSAIASDDILIKLYKQNLMDQIFSLSRDAMAAHLVYAHKCMYNRISDIERMTLYDAIRNIWQHVSDLEIQKYTLYNNDEGRKNMIMEVSKEYLAWYEKHSAYQRNIIKVKEYDLYLPIYFRLVNDCELEILRKSLDIFASIDIQKMDNTHSDSILSTILRL